MCNTFQLQFTSSENFKLSDENSRGISEYRIMVALKLWPPYSCHNIFSMSHQRNSN